MAAQKLEKALYGPSLVEVVLGVILGLLAGVAAAAIYLVFKPVKTVPKEPTGKDAIRSMVYYIPGAMASGRARDWQAKQKQFLAGTPVTLVEDQLNAWGASLPSPAVSVPAKPSKTPPKPGEKPAPPAPEGFIIPSTPNFRIVDGRLQVGLKCILNWYGFMDEVTFQATGGFRRDGDQFVFVPDTVYLGSCPLHLLPAASNLFVSLISGKEKVPDEVRAAWAKLGNVTIEGNTLKLAAQ